MKILLFGYGSIGKRHAANVHSLLPDAALLVYDPVLFATDPIHGTAYDDWQEFLLAYGEDAGAAIIASPTECHFEQMEQLAEAGLPFYVEKPLGTLAPPTRTGRSAVGFQYRFHPAVHRLRRLALGNKLLEFRAEDDLLGRYGRDVAGIMASHAFDLALWLLGPAEEIGLRSDGVHLGGQIIHTGGKSTYAYNLDAGARRSVVLSGPSEVDLVPLDAVYRDCLGAWLGWVNGGQQDSRTATIADGLAVQHILALVKESA